MKELSPICFCKRVSCGTVYESCYESKTKNYKSMEQMPLHLKIEGMWKGLAIAVFEKDIKASTRIVMSLKYYLDPTKAQKISRTSKDARYVYEPVDNLPDDNQLPLIE